MWFWFGMVWACSGRHGTPLRRVWLWITLCPTSGATHSRLAPGIVVCAGGWLGSWISSPFGPGLPRTSTPFKFCAQIAARVQMGYPALHCIASGNGIAVGEEWITPPSNCMACKLKENLEIPGTSSGHLCGPSPLVVTGLLADCVSRSQISVSQLWTCVSIQPPWTSQHVTL